MIDLHEFLCNHGIHKWKEFRMADTFIAAFPGYVEKGRDCLACGRLEYFDIKHQVWQQGARGTLQYGN